VCKSFDKVNFFRLKGFIVAPSSAKIRNRCYGCLSAWLIFLIISLACAGQNDSPSESTRIAGAAETRDKKESELTPGPAHKPAYVPDEVLVGFHADTDPRAIERIRHELLLKVVRVFSSRNLFLMQITDGSSVEDMIQRLKNYDAVDYAEPNYAVKAIQ
jgi:hypothetical protein